MLNVRWIFIGSGLVTLEKVRVIDYRANADLPVPPAI